MAGQLDDALEGQHSLPVDGVARLMAVEIWRLRRV